MNGKRAIQYILDNTGYRRKLRIYEREKKHYSELSDDELEVRFLDYSAKIERKKHYITLWVSVIFTATMTGFGKIFLRWFGLLVSSQKNIKAIAKITVTEKNSLDFVNITFWGIVLVLLVGLFYELLYSIGTIKRKLLIIEKERNVRGK